MYRVVREFVRYFVLGKSFSDVWEYSCDHFVVSLIKYCLQHQRGMEFFLLVSCC